MAIKKTIEIDVNTSDAVKGVDGLNNSINDLTSSLKDGQKQANTTTKQVEEVGKAGKSAKSGLKAVSSGFKAIGTAIKAAGVGLVIGLFLTLKEVLGKNQKVVDTLSSAMGTVSIVINKVFDVVTNTVSAVSKATNGFDALGKVLSGLVTVGIAPLKIGFNAIKLGLQQAQLAWEKSFFGDNDPKTVKELNKAILETETNIRTVSAETTKAGKDIINNFGEAVSEVGALSSGIIENVSKVSIKASFEQSKLTQQLANNAKLATAEQRKLIEKYDIQAEKLRQVRDNDLLSIEERKKANDELKTVLDNQEKAMLAQANAVLASAEAELKKSNNIENQVALIDAQANKLGVVAQIETFRSEQDVNKNSLIKETNELVQSGIEADTLRALNQQKFNTELEEDELKKLERQKTDLEKEREIEAERLQAKIDSFALGTQARLDAENELKDRLQEIDNEITLNTLEQNKVRTESETKTANEKIALQNATVNNLQKIFGQETAIGKALLIAKQAIAAQELILQIKSDIAAAKSSATKATLKASEAGVDIASGAAKTLGAAPFPANIPLIVGYAASAVGIATSISSALKKVKGAKGDISTTPSGGGASAPPPAFNLVGGSNVNEIGDTLNQEQTPIQAYVVGSEVTNQQEIDNAQASSASIG